MATAWISERNGPSGMVAQGSSGPWIRSQRRPPRPWPLEPDSIGANKDTGPRRRPLQPQARAAHGSVRIGVQGCLKVLPNGDTQGCSASGIASSTGLDQTLQRRSAAMAGEISTLKQPWIGLDSGAAPHHSRAAQASATAAAPPDSSPARKTDPPRAASTPSELQNPEP
jgi:hypothetical protein